MPLKESYINACTMQHNAEPLPWLKTHRKHAFEQLQQMGWPTRKQELWKYTNTAPITDTNFLFANTTHNAIKQSDLDDILLKQENTHKLVFINSQYNTEYSNIGTLANGVSIGNFRDILEQQPTLIENIFNQFADQQHAFAALNTACFTDGAFIHVPDDVVIEKPIIVYFISNNAQEQLLNIPRNLIILGKHAQASVMESFYSLKETKNFTNAVTEIHTAEGSKLEYYKITQGNSNSFHIGGTYIKQSRNSSLKSYTFTLGGAITRNDICVELSEEGAEILFNGLYMGNEKQHMDNHTIVSHVKPNTQSSSNYRGILDNFAQGVFNGLVVVHEGAHQIQATQSNANLLLSDHAQINTKPALEIYADDVQCTHNATVGQIDEEMLFYLQSRGINREVAKSALIFAFANEIIQSVNCLPFQKWLQNNIGGDAQKTAELLLTSSNY